VTERLRQRISAERREEQAKNLRFLKFMRNVYKALTENSIAAAQKKAQFKFDFLTKVASSALTSLRQELEGLKNALASERQEVRRLLNVISENKRPAIYLIAEEPFMGVRQPGWVVIDATWKRGPMHLNESGYLATASEDFKPTVFYKEEDALKAIEDTRNFNNGSHTWSNNVYFAVQMV
jgi:hypothetical protein